MLPLQNVLVDPKYIVICNDRRLHDLFDSSEFYMLVISCALFRLERPAILCFWQMRSSSVKETERNNLMFFQVKNILRNNLKSINK
jgi:hypothetical protein